jgi:hypothetical protein
MLDRWKHPRGVGRSDNVWGFLPLYTLPSVFPHPLGLFRTAATAALVGRSGGVGWMLRRRWLGDGGVGRPNGRAAPRVGGRWGNIDGGVGRPNGRAAPHHTNVGPSNVPVSRRWMVRRLLCSPRIHSLYISRRLIHTGLLHTRPTYTVRIYTRLAHSCTTYPMSLRNVYVLLTYSPLIYSRTVQARVQRQGRPPYRSEMGKH